MKNVFKLTTALCVALAMCFASCVKEGPAGKDGKDGKDGINGKDGRDGRHGSSIITGSGAPLGNLGSEGDFYLDLTTSDFYGPKKASGWGTPISLKGLQGERGEVGANGRDGVNGTKIFSGNGEPNTNTGNEGDFYIDLENKKLYGPKTAQGWGQGVLLGATNSVSSVVYDYFNLSQTQVYVQMGSTYSVKILSGSGSYTLQPQGTNASVTLSSDKQSLQISGTSEGEMQVVITDTIVRKVITLTIQVVTPNTILTSDYTLSNDGTTLIRWNNDSTKVIDMEADPHLRNVTRIGSGAFKSEPVWNSKSVTFVKLPMGLKTIEREAFYGCSSLTSITIPNSVTSIGEWAFSNCRSLTSITIPNSVTHIGGYAFSYCSSLTSIAIPNSVTSIGGLAFSNCSSLASITIPNSVTNIGSEAFSNCSSLTSITIPNSVTHIGYRAFSGCRSLTSITIPNSVTNIGREAFSSCEQLESITIQGNQVGAEQNIFKDTYNLKNIYVPRGSVQWYKAANNWSQYADKIKSI